MWVTCELFIFEWSENYLSKLYIILFFYFGKLSLLRSQKRNSSFWTLQEAFKVIFFCVCKWNLKSVLIIFWDFSSLEYIFFGLIFLKLELLSYFENTCYYFKLTDIQSIFTNHCFSTYFISKHCILNIF